MLEISLSTCYNLPKGAIDCYDLGYTNRFRVYYILRRLCFYPCSGRDPRWFARKSSDLYERTNKKFPESRLSNTENQKNSQTPFGQVNTPLVVLDSNVFFNAADNPSGNSALLIKLARKKKIKVAVSRYILDESIENLRKKSTPKACERHNRNVTTVFPIRLEPPSGIIQSYRNIINPRDAPVLALATTINAHYLVTLDAKHFIKNPGVSMLKFPFKIVTPGQFIEILGERKLKFLNERNK